MKVINRIKQGDLKESIRLRARNWYIDQSYEKRRKLINNEDFSIISDNCWGGTVYQSYGISYKSPTVGMYIVTEDYIKLLSNLKYYMSLELDFVRPKESKHLEKLKYKSNFGTFPIGKLDDIELMLLHYESEAEAYEKWHRRSERINWDKLIIKLNDQNLCEEEHILAFDRMKYTHKLFFTAKKRDNIKSEIYLKEAKGQKCVRASQEPFGKNRYININQLINSL